MARPAADSVKVEWAGTGAGTMSLGSNVSGFASFPASADGLPVSYEIAHQTASERENGLGTYTAAGNTLSRDFVTFSTAGAPTKVTFSAGIKHVRLTALASDFVENRATTDPTSSDGITAGYVAGRSRWLNTATSTLWFCVDDSPGSPGAVWRSITSSGLGSVQADEVDVEEYGNYVAGNAQISLQQLDDAVASLEAAPVPLALDAVSGAAKSLTSGTWTTLTNATRALVVLGVDFVDAGFSIIKKDSNAGTINIAVNNGLTVNGESGVASSKNVTDCAVTSSSGASCTFTSAGGNLPLISAGKHFQYRNHSVTALNGWYVATGSPTTSSLPATKLVNQGGGTLVNPSNQAAEEVDIDQPVNLTLESRTSVKREGTDFDVSGGTNASKSFDGSDLTNIGRIYGYRSRKYGGLTGAQTLNAANFTSGSKLVHTGGAATYTVPSRLAATDVAATEELTVRNGGSGVITWSASGVTLLGDTGTLAVGETAVLEWEHDGTTQRVEIRSTA